MTKFGYEMVDARTGEVKFIETVVDIGPLKAYNEWVIENKLNPPKFEPEDYARYMEGVDLRKRVDDVLDFIRTYDVGSPWPLQSIKKILTDEE
ncbi:hypothetical protein UFOVP536_47 [uncultured Caudovirales phage]|uniref:Uncharacterized protein n=1 Tax=uncultured Caudovirales phage TaxID=2100421 RepID=A0A6J5MZF0_9CAUD|nr:hypothetical protein UFOVP536_47 [uncultured Caudovirales phage]